MINEQNKEKIITIISALYPTIKIYLLGSQATGKAGAGSDVDIALDNGQRMERKDIGEIRDMLNASNIPHIFDILDYRSISPSFQEIIQKEGILWKQ